MNSKNKIVRLQTLKKASLRLRQKGKKISFTNGCFDILHFGHVSYLEASKRKDRILIVGLNSDSSIRKIKGKGRPIVPEDKRARVLAALSCVDYVTIFNEETPYQTIKALKPDILIKGADWKGKGIVGQYLVESHGGKVEFIRYFKGFSTTNMITSIIKKCKR